MITMSEKFDKLSLAILLGGKSTRIGREKANLKLLSETGESSFLEVIAKELTGLDDSIDEKYLSVNSKQKYSIQGFKNVTDIVNDIGPLGGIYSVLKSSKKDFVLFVACDMPYIKKEALWHLIDGWNGESLCISRTQNGRQPLVGIYGKGCIPFIEELINNRIFRPGLLLDLVESKVISMSDYKECFVNINTIEDYREITDYEYKI